MSDFVNNLVIKGVRISLDEICSLKAITILPIIYDITNIILKI